MCAEVLKEIMDSDFWKIATVVIAGIVAWISWSQYSVSKEKFKLDLFEKRFQVFAATRKLLTIVMQRANIEIDDLFEFRANTGEAAFLFDTDITTYLSKIDKKVIRLHTLKEEMKSLPVGEKRSEKAEQISECLKWLGDQLPELKHQFGPYMKFKVWK